MFCVIDRGNYLVPVKSGFKTAAQANNWAKKNLSREDVRLWGEKSDFSKPCRYFVRMK